MSFATLWVNDVWMGVYNLVEDVDSVFLKSRFGESKGNIYKAGGGGSSMAYLGPDVRFAATPLTIVQRILGMLLADCTNSMAVLDVATSKTETETGRISPHWSQ